MRTCILLFVSIMAAATSREASGATWPDAIAGLKKAIPAAEATTHAPPSPKPAEPSRQFPVGEPDWEIALRRSLGRGSLMEIPVLVPIRDYGYSPPPWLWRCKPTRPKMRARRRQYAAA